MSVVIQSFGDKDTERLANGQRVRRFASFERIALRKLATLDAATSLLDLGQLPGSRLELLRGNLAEKYSIRINDQWRVVFAWVDNNAENVAIVDYH